MRLNPGQLQPVPLSIFLHLLCTRTRGISGTGFSWAGCQERRQAETETERGKATDNIEANIDAFDQHRGW